jgi:hypothetical protein
MRNSNGACPNAVPVTSNPASAVSMPVHFFVTLIDVLLVLVAATLAYKSDRP